MMMRMIPLLAGLLTAALAAVPVAIVWDTRTALVVAAVMALLLWPLLSLAHWVILWLVRNAFTARRARE